MLCEGWWGGCKEVGTKVEAGQLTASLKELNDDGSKYPTIHTYIYVYIHTHIHNLGFTP